MNRSLLKYLVAFAAFLGPFTQTVYAPILPELGKALDTTPFMINLSISIFTLVLAVMQIVYGPLVDRRGRRGVLLAGLAVYIGASLGCFLSDNIDMLLVFRALQAVGIAAAAVVAVVVIGDLFGPEERPRAMSTFQMMVSLGPVLGPVAGGFVGQHFDYHYVFLLLVLAGVVVFACNALCLRETRPAGAHGEPFRLGVYADVLRNRQGLPIILLAFVQYYAFYNFLVFMPHVLDTHYGLDAGEKGLVFLPLSIAVVLGSYLGGRIQALWPPRRALLMTTSLNVAAILLFTVVAPLSLTALVVAISAFGLFLGLSLPVQISLLLEAYPQHRATAVGTYNFSRFFGMACGPVWGTWLFHSGSLWLLYGFAAALFALAISFAWMRFAQH